MTKTSYLSNASKIVLAAAATAAIATSFAGQASAATSAGTSGSSPLTMSVGATVVTPIEIAQTQAMNFGSLATNVTNQAVGTIVLAPNDIRSATGGVDLVDSGAPQKAGHFTVAAQSGYNYNVTLPDTVTLTSGSETMTVDGFNAGQNLISVSATGSAQSYTVGATLHAKSGQKAGDYTGTFVVTAAYN